MVRIEKSIEIEASPEKVWEMLAFDRRIRSFSLRSKTNGTIYDFFREHPTLGVAY